MTSVPILKDATRVLEQQSCDEGGKMHVIDRDSALCWHADDSSFPERNKYILSSFGSPRTGERVTVVPPTERPLEGVNLVLATSTTNTERDATAKGDDTTCFPTEGNVTSQTTWL